MKVSITKTKVMGVKEKHVILWNIIILNSERFQFMWWVWRWWSSRMLLCHWVCMVENEWHSQTIVGNIIILPYNFAHPVGITNFRKLKRKFCTSLIWHNIYNDHQCKFFQQGPYHHHGYTDDTTELQSWKLMDKNADIYTFYLLRDMNGPKRCSLLTQKHK